MEIHVAVLHKKPCVNLTQSHPGFTTPLPPIPPTPPSPPPLPITHNQSPSPFLIIMFCGLTICFSFVCYLTLAKICGMRRRNRGNTDDHEAHEAHEDLGPVVHNPIWLINTIGLNESQIEAIGFFKYKRDEKLIEGDDCSVCLSEFEDDEHLRLLPKCSHAFHVHCIDTWLRSHKNCPLCRAPIVKNTNHDQNELGINESNSIESSSTSNETETPVDDSETINDHHVVEVENNGEVVKTSSTLYENAVANTQSSSSGSGSRVRVQGEELVSNSERVVLKKPSSMPKRGHKLKGSSSSSSIHIYRKSMKSSSFGRSLRKTSSFTNKCRPHNQSY